MNPVRVVKVGGSLFDWTPLPSALAAWLAERSEGDTVLIGGGGAPVDFVRAVDRRYALGQEAAHWMCIDLLRTSARLLANLVPQARFEQQWCELQSCLENCALRQEGIDTAGSVGDGGLQTRPRGSNRWIVFDPVDFCRDVEPTLPGERLTTTWDSTSDAVAARMATGLQAAELVLLKSVDAEPGASLTALAEAGVVDRVFPRVAALLPRVRVVNLRRRTDW